MKKLFAALLAGAALVYFTDPGSGSRRRHMTMDRLGAMFRRLGDRSGKMTRFVSGQVYGTIMETVPHAHDNPANPDNKTLKDRVESEVLRNPTFGRAPINFNVVEDSVVVIRGELPNPQDINDLVNQVKAIRGVKEVHSYLHLPNTPAPNKESVLRVETS